MSNADGAGVQSVDRALTILERLARSGEAGVTEIAGELGVHKSTAFRLVATLEAHRLVEQTEDRGKYRLGVGLLRLAGATTARLDLVQEARPVCRQLASETGETVNIAVLSESSALYLDQVAGSSALQPHNWVGQHIPLHATSNGKVLLSGLNRQQCDAMLSKLSAYTPTTITTKGKLRAELDQVREQGYALAVDELEVGPDRGGGADPQRARRCRGVDERLRPDVPDLLGPGRGDHRQGRGGRRGGLPPSRLGTPLGHGSGAGA